MSASIHAKKHVVTFDCPDAKQLADFYARLLGWQIDYSPDEPDWVDVIPPQNERFGFEIACQRVENYLAPEWPDGAVPQQMHLDLYVESLDEASAHAEAVGATRHAVQPSESGSFIVFLDLAGHPFCLCAI